MLELLSWSSAWGLHLRGLGRISVRNAPLCVQVDKTQSPVLSVYALSLHRQGKSLRSHDETESPDVTQVIYCRVSFVRESPGEHIGGL